MLLFFVCPILSVVFVNADELLKPATEPPQQVISPSPELSHWISLQSEPGGNNEYLKPFHKTYVPECTLGSYACRLACLNGGICYKNSNRLRFFIVGDTGGLPVYPYTTYAQNVVAKSLAKIGDDKNTEFTISAGDNIYFTGVKDEFDHRFQATFENVYRGAALEKPWYMIAGNHDHFGNISGQVAYTNRSHRWTYPSSYYKVSYAFGSDKTTVEFLMLDTIVLCGNTRDVVEAGFFEMLFATHEILTSTVLLLLLYKVFIFRADYLFVVGHYPLYSVSEHGSMDCLIEKLKPLLEQYRATAYIAGHDHTLQVWLYLIL
ncbi:unnamed protein product [Gongylonema pulchrum]|uniref:Tartrate-resistant acid phosphatase type 5 n=1 Tax=Gongylonema pulchrum TaxID=637853 RepID=A0A183EFC1_9BILA|nr:unnamed protein product [Gongylonema pulchrum]